jgi:hypothetical protein
LAISNKILTIFYDSPLHFDAKDDAVTLKKVVAPLEATALARSVLPVPGGPNKRTPFHALLFPVKSSGKFKGSKTASSRISLALLNSAISSNVMFGLRSTTYLSKDSIKLVSGPFPSG